MAEDWRNWSRSWQDGTTFAHPDSPMGGGGPGRFRQPGPLGIIPIADCQPGLEIHPHVPHPQSPLARFYHNHFEHLDLWERCRAVWSAVMGSFHYIPQALLEATGQELYAVVKGIIPALLAALAVIAVTTAFGAAAGAVIGFFAGGVGAAPGAAAGASVGFDAGLYLLEVLGLSFLIAYIGTALLKAVQTATQGAEEAWASVDHPELKERLIHAASRKFADAVALVFRGVLQGVVAFLLAKGTAAAASRVGELISNLRASKIGGAFADWVEQNWRRLVDEPKLREERGTGGAGAAEDGGVLSVLKQAGTARRAQSYQDIDAYQQKYEALEQQARAAGDTRAAGGYKALVTEAIGERAAARYMEQNNPDFVMDQGFSPGKGFDQVYSKYDTAGNPLETMVVEAKGPNALLSTTAAKGPQMSQQWVESTVGDMVKSQDAATSALGTRMQNALDFGDTPLTGKVIQALPGGGAQEIPLPSNNTYNGGIYN